MPKTPTQLSDLAARKAKSKDIVYTLTFGARPISSRAADRHQTMDGQVSDP